jgi:hypothetical protein
MACPSLGERELATHRTGKRVGGGKNEGVGFPLRHRRVLWRRAGDPAHLFYGRC